VELVKHEGTVNDAIFSPDAVWLVTASNDQSVRFWPLRLEDLRTEAAARLGRNLTYDEWQKFFPDEPYPRTFATLPVHPSVRDKASELAEERRRAKESTPENLKQPSPGQAP
jgi:WD40 repeat protein